MATLATWCQADGALGTVAPLALAAAAGTALVIDVDPDGPIYPGSGSLADLVDDGPRLSDLRPLTSGVAVLRNGGITLDDAREVIEALRKSWPNLVLRAPASGPLQSLPTVPVVPLLPGVTRRVEPVAVYQQIGWHEQAPGPALTLPTPSRGAVRALLEGHMPWRSRWIDAWRAVWELPWA